MRGRLLRLLLFSAGLMAAMPASAQVTRLPPTDLTTPPHPGQLASYPGDVSQVFTDLAPPERLPPVEPAGDGFPSCDGLPTCDGLPSCSEPPLPPEHRAGFFQKVVFDAAYLPRTGSAGMGVSDLEGKVVFAVPFPTVEWPLLIVPGYGVHFIDGPQDVEMPARLHDAYLAFRWLPKFSERLSAEVTVAPGVFSDFEQSSDDAFRLTGYGAATYAWTNTTKLVLGAGYFDRLAVDVLPIGGIIWTPSERVNFELLFPRPKLAWQCYGCGADGRRVQDWLYLAAEFGGGAWAFARRDGSADVVDFSDYRIYTGVERTVRGGLDARLEVGYVFGREIKYHSRPQSFTPNDTLMLRAGLRY